MVFGASPLKEGPKDILCNAVLYHKHDVVLKRSDVLGVSFSESDWQDFPSSPVSVKKSRIGE